MAANAPDIYVALLRGINVGGKNSLPMKDLTAIFTAAGCKDVKTYIQSGNVVFRAAPAVVKTLTKKISAAIEKQHGLRIPVVLFSFQELAAAVKQNPFATKASDEKVLHMYFLGEEPAKEKIAGLDTNRSLGDSFHAKGRSIYLHLPQGMARTKLTNVYFDKQLGTICTARNWTTTLKLLAMMQE